MVSIKNMCALGFSTPHPKTKPLGEVKWGGSYCYSVYSRHRSCVSRSLSLQGDIYCCCWEQRVGPMRRMVRVFGKGCGSLLYSRI